MAGDDANEEADAANLVDPVTTTEAAALLGISTGYLNRLCRSGAIPWQRQGRRYIFERSELLAWMEERRVEPGTITYLLPSFYRR